MIDGVHKNHCCAGVHGCRYGDGDCPVANGRTAPAYKCRDCEDAPAQAELEAAVAAERETIIELIDGLVEVARCSTHGTALHGAIGMAKACKLLIKQRGCKGK